MANKYLDAALYNLRLYLKREQDGSKRMCLLHILSDLELGMINAHDAIKEAKLLGVRHPSYDGEMVGWLDDDFDEDKDTNQETD